MELQTKDRLDTTYVYTNCYLKVFKSDKKEILSIVKLFINNFEGIDENGIVIGYWKCTNNELTFVPLTPSHYELISDLFYIKNNDQIPKIIGETKECNTSMETLNIK